MNRRCCCAASRVKISSLGRTIKSSHGEYQPIGALSCGVWKMSSSQTICTQVVPVFKRLLMTMSPSRKGKPAHLYYSCCFSVCDRAAAQRGTWLPC